MFQREKKSDTQKHKTVVPEMKELSELKGIAQEQQQTMLATKDNTSVSIAATATTYGQRTHSHNTRNSRKRKKPTT